MDLKNIPDSGSDDTAPIGSPPETNTQQQATPISQQTPNFQPEQFNPAPVVPQNDIQPIQINPAPQVETTEEQSTPASHNPYPEPQTALPMQNSLNPIESVSSTSPNNASFPPVQTHPSPALPTNSVQTVYGGASFNSSQISSKKSFRRLESKKFVMGGIVAALIIVLGSAGYVFALYIPNKPENVWNTGLNRTGKALDKIISDSTTQPKLNQIKNSQLTASLEIKAQDFSYKGTLDTKFDDNNATGSIRFANTQGGDEEQKLAIDFISQLAKGKEYPDSFVKVSGLSALGLDSFVPGINQYEGKWVSISSDYIKSLIPNDAEASKKTIQINQQDISDLAKALTQTAVDYIFTSDPSKGIVERKEFIGKEKIDSITAYHYKAGYNKQHAKDYCAAVVNAALNSSAYKKLGISDEKNLDKDKKSAVESCQKSVETDIKDSDRFDVWVDAKYKLIHKIRFEDTEDAYTEITQNYSGGDELGIKIYSHDDKSKEDITLELNTNLKNSITKATMTFTGGENQDKYAVNGTLEAKPYDGTVKVDQPKDAIPIKDLIKNLGLDQELSSSYNDGIVGLSADSAPLGQTAADSERQTDINALHGQIEAYYATNGFYPNLGNLNDIPWVKENLVGLDPAALKDPAGTTSIFLQAPDATHYGYSPSGCTNSGKECQAYVLSAKFSTGELYTKNSLN